MLVTIKPTGGGVNKDLPANEMDAAQWSDALNMRFVNGLAETRGGIRAAFTTPTVIPYSACCYETTAGRFLVQAGLAKVFADDGTTRTEITRYTDGAAISSITSIATTATVTTATAHGRTTGNSVTVFGTDVSAYNITATITVTGANTFTYTIASYTGSATVVGQYSYNVQSDFTGTADDRWSIFPFNGVLILNNPKDGPYYWNGDVTTRMRRLPGWSSGDKAYGMGAYKDFLVAWAPTLSSSFYPHNIMWSAAAEPGAVPLTWTASSTNDAGDTPQAAESIGQLIDGLSLGDQFILYGSDSRYAMDFIGGNDVMRVYKLPGNDGVLARGCVVSTPKGHVFISNGDVKIHAGGNAASIVEGTVRRWIFSYMDTTYGSRSFAAVNPIYNEVWIAFPSYGQSSSDTVMAWNWGDDTRAIFSIPLATCATTGLIAAAVGQLKWNQIVGSWRSQTKRWAQNEYSINQQRLILGHYSLAIGLADTGTTDLGSEMTWSLEKRGSSLSDNSDMKVVTWSVPQAEANNGVAITVSHAATKLVNDQPSYGTARTFTIGSSARVNKASQAGRFLSIKLEGTDRIRLRSYDVNVEPAGQF